HSWVTVLGFEQGIQNELDLSSMRGGKASGGEATLKVAPDGSVVDMLRGCTEGGSFDLTLHFVQNASLEGAGQVLVSLEFERVVFSGISMSGGDGDDFICIEVTFVYGSLEFTQSAFYENPVFERSLSTTMDFEFSEHSGPAITEPV